MTYFIFFVVIALFLAWMVSSTRWKLSKDLLNSIYATNFGVYKVKSVSATAKLKAGETLGISISSTVLISDQEIHLIPNKFHLLLFMTDFPFSFYKKDNKKFKVVRSENKEIVFTSTKKSPSTFGKVFEVTIRVHHEEEKLEMLRSLKKWR
ncbi:hypothetical protein N8371_01410 [Vicingaceae bacterium]|nr:hypothetical protein [Vicingaceae bacterium]MDC1451061.1 hypothetical protein [Vicingaceae bacterium]